MAAPDVDIVRELMGRFEGVDVAGIDWGSKEIEALLRPALTEDMQINTLTSGLGTGVAAHYEGWDGAVSYFKAWFEPFSEYRLELLDFVEESGRVLVPSRQWGVGEGSGARAELELTYLFELRDGLVCRMDQYDTLEEARRAAGDNR